MIDPSVFFHVDEVAVRSPTTSDTGVGNAAGPPVEYPRLDETAGTGRFSVGEANNATRRDPERLAVDGAFVADEIAALLPDAGPPAAPTSALAGSIATTTTTAAVEAIVAAKMPRRDAPGL